MSSTLPIKLEPISEKLAKFYAEIPEDQVTPFNDMLVPYVQAIETMADLLPKIIKGTANAEAAMAKITNIESEEDIEQTMGLLGKVKESYEVNQERRKKITAPMAEMSKFLMSFEKKVSTDAKEDNHYNRLKGLIQRRQQEILNERRRQEAEAAKRREREDHKVALELEFNKKLAAALIETVKKADESIQSFINQFTVENFDEQSEKLLKAKPTFKQNIYDSCFMGSVNPSLIDEDELLILIKECKEKEPYSKWQAAYVEQVTPTIEKWKGKLPELKAEKIAIANAKDEAERVRLEKEKKAREDAADKQRQDDLAAKQKQMEEDAKREADLKSMENNFREQGAVQELADPGLIKKTLRLSDDVKEIPAALTKIVFQCMMHKDFEGIYQLDKNGKRKLDTAGRPEYATGIQWWLTQFQKMKIDLQIQGTVWVEDSKVIIRK